MKTFRCIFDRYKKSVGGSSCNQKRSRKVALPKDGEQHHPERTREKISTTQKSDAMNHRATEQGEKAAPGQRRRGSTTQGRSSSSHPSPLSPLPPFLPLPSHSPHTPKKREACKRRQCAAPPTRARTDRSATQKNEGRRWNNQKKTRGKSTARQGEGEGSTTQRGTCVLPPWVGVAFLTPPCGWCRFSVVLLALLLSLGGAAFSPLSL